MRSLSRALGAATLAMAMTTTGLAFGGDTSTAEHLFQQGQDAMKRAQYKDACDAFAGSNEADPSPGTQINLALCNEKQAKLASAWGWYRTAAGLAEQRGQRERAELARTEATKLEPKLHKLVISVKFPSEGIAVTRNGAPVPSAVLGTDVPIDPGEYAIEVTAKGKKPWKQTVHIAAAPGIDHLDVPALEDAPPEPKAAAPGPTPGADYRPPSTGGSDGSTQRTVGFVVGGVGLLALVTAGGLEIFNLAVTKPAYNDVEKQSTANKCSEAAAAATKNCQEIKSSLDEKDSARSTNDIAAVVVGAVGVAALVTGVVLLVTAPSGRASASVSRPLVLPIVGRDSAGVGVLGTF